MGEMRFPIFGIMVCYQNEAEIFDGPAKLRISLNLKSHIIDPFQNKTSSVQLQIVHQLEKTDDVDNYIV